MPVDSREPNRNYLEPNVGNFVSEEFARLIQTVRAIGVDVKDLFTSMSGKANVGHGHSIADVSGLDAALTARSLTTHNHTLGSLSDVNTTGVATGMFLSWNGTAWQPVAVTPSLIGAIATTAATAFGLSILGATNAAAGRTALQLGSSALTSDDRIAYNPNTDTTIAANARVAALNVALTGARSMSLPAVNTPGAPPYVIVIDEARGISGTNTLTLNPFSGDNINGLSSLTLNTAGAAVILERDYANRWTAISTGGGGGVGQDQIFTYTATAGQTVISGVDRDGNTLSYTPTQERVFINGRLIPQPPPGGGGTTYTRTSSTVITLAAAISAGDVVQVVAPTPFAVANVNTKAEDDARFLRYDGVQTLNASQQAQGRANIGWARRAYDQYLTFGAITTNTPIDDTIPQVTEGVQILSATITPQLTTSRLRIRAVVAGAGNAVGDTFVVALHTSAGADALRAALIVQSVGQYIQSIPIEHEYVPGVTTAITISVRVGVGAGNTFRTNGNSTSRYMGGASACTLVVEEILT